MKGCVGQGHDIEDEVCKHLGKDLEGGYKGRFKWDVVANEGLVIPKGMMQTIKKYVGQRDKVEGKLNNDQDEG